MLKNPILNAILAGAYIVLLVLFMQYGAQATFNTTRFTLLIPMVMISLFTLSAAVMGTLFVMTPLQMYLDGKKKEGVTFFFKTLGSFTVITVIALVALFLTALR